MIKKIIATICILMILLPCILAGGVFAFYSDRNQIERQVTTGNIQASIEGLKLSANGSVWEERERLINSGILRVNTASVVSFSVKNTGNSRIDYRLNLQIAWKDQVSERGKIFVFPEFVSDGDILQSVIDGDFSQSIVGIETSDTQQIQLPQATLEGIDQQLDFAQLQSTTAKEYAFKLFLYEDSDLKSNPADYHSKELLVNLVVNFDKAGLATGWAGTTSKNFSINSVIDTVFPLVTEVAGAKTFFVTQGSEVDLMSYATASDTLDGDITQRIKITSSPSFDPNKAGIYTVTYNVVNSVGNSAVPLQIQIVIWDFVKIESGDYHTLALTSHGRVYSWGYNYNGQVGDGTTTFRSVPQLVEDLNGIVDIAAGSSCSFALDFKGQAYAWGLNGGGRLGDGTTTARHRPVLVKQPIGVEFVQISSRFTTSGGVTTSGEVYTWGYGGYGALGTGQAGDKHVPTKINLENIAHVELGYYNGAAITNDGVLYTWGDNANGQMGTGAPMVIGANAPTVVGYFADNNISIKNFSVGWYHMGAVADNGQLYTWGYGTEGRLGINSVVNRNTPQLVSISNAARVETGYYHTAVLDQDGKVYFFGQNAYGKHGSGNTTNHLTPNLLENVSTATDISLARDSSFVLTGSAVFGMGYGGTGVLGNGNSNSSNRPVQWAFVPPNPY